MGLVDAPSHASGDPLNDPHQMLRVAKRHLRRLQLTKPLDVHLMRTVDEDVRHGWIGKQRLQPVFGGKTVAFEEVSNGRVFSTIACPLRGTSLCE